MFHKNVMIAAESLSSKREMEVSGAFTCRCWRHFSVIIAFVSNLVPSTFHVTNNNSLARAMAQKSMASHQPRWLPCFANYRRITLYRRLSAVARSRTHTRYIHMYVFDTRVVIICHQEYIYFKMINLVKTICLTH